MESSGGAAKAPGDKSPASTAELAGGIGRGAFGATGGSFSFVGAGTGTKGGVSALAGSGGAIASEELGLTLAVWSVLAGRAAVLIGEDAGLAASVERASGPFATVVESA